VKEYAWSALIVCVAIAVLVFAGAVAHAAWILILLGWNVL
jgi:hypothetical protein